MLNGSEKTSWDASVLEMHRFLKVLFTLRLILGDLLHPVASEIYFRPRTLRVGPVISAQRSTGHPHCRYHQLHTCTLSTAGLHLFLKALLLARPIQPPKLETGTPSVPHGHEISQTCPFYSSIAQAQLPALPDPSSPPTHCPPSGRVRCLKAKHRARPLLRIFHGSHCSQGEGQAPPVAFQTHRIWLPPTLLASLPVTPSPTPTTQAPYVPLQPTELAVPLIFSNVQGLGTLHPLAWNLHSLFPPHLLDSLESSYSDL